MKPKDKRAKFLLESLRKGCDGDTRLFDILASELSGEISKHNLSPAELWVSLEEPKQLFIKNRKLRAEQLVHTIRRPPCMILALDQLRRMIEKKWFTLDEVGITKEELERRDSTLGPESPNSEERPDGGSSDEKK